MCGRYGAGTELPYCAACTDIFALPRGKRVYDEETGEPWLRSNGDRGLVNVDHWSKSRARWGIVASGTSWRTLWWILLIRAAILHGCLRALP